MLIIGGVTFNSLSGPVSCSVLTPRHSGPVFLLCGDFHDSVIGSCNSGPNIYDDAFLEALNRLGILTQCPVTVIVEASDHSEFSPSSFPLHQLKNRALTATYKHPLGASTKLSSTALFRYLTWWLPDIRNIALFTEPSYPYFYEGLVNMFVQSLMRPVWRPRFRHRIIQTCAYHNITVNIFMEEFRAMIEAVLFKHDVSFNDVFPAQYTRFSYILQQGHGDEIMPYLQAGLEQARTDATINRSMYDPTLWDAICNDHPWPEVHQSVIDVLFIWVGLYVDAYILLGLRTNHSKLVVMYLGQYHIERLITWFRRTHDMVYTTSGSRCMQFTSTVDLDRIVFTV